MSETPEVFTSTIFCLYLPLPLKKSNVMFFLFCFYFKQPHSCNACGKRFALKSYLYKHEESSCMKNKTEGKVKQKRSGKGRKDSHSYDSSKCSPEKSQEMILKNQQSAFVKEKIKSIFEDRIQNHIENGEKKTFITLKPRQELELSGCGNPIIENRISVIRSVSSFLIEQQCDQNLCTPVSFQYVSEQAANI